jgi:hypothetical protein
VPSTALTYLFLGLVPLLVWLPTGVLRLDASRPAHAVAAGLAVTSVNLVAGVAGPLLDVFFVRTSLGPPRGRRDEGRHPGAVAHRQGRALRRAAPGGPRRRPARARAAARRAAVELGTVVGGACSTGCPTRPSAPRRGGSCRRSV